MLDQAYCNSLFVLNEKANDKYNEMLNKITQTETETKVNTLTNKQKLRYVMISERLGLKYPESWKNIE